LNSYHSYDTILERADLRELTREMDQVLRRGGHRDMIVPDREVMFQRVPEAVFVSMPAVSSEQGLYINKVASIFDRPSDSRLPCIHAYVIAFSSQTGEPIAILDGAALTNLKCAAISALITDYCAVEDAKTLAIVGAGVQARQQFLGVCSVRNISEIRLYARNRDKVRLFAEEIRAASGGEIHVLEACSLEDAIDSADVVGTATAAAVPLGEFANLTPAVHINCMGGHTEQSRELPRSILESSLLIVEHLPTAIAEAGELHRAALELDSLARTTPAILRQRRTVFSSTGHASLDLMTTAHVLRRLQ
jgi:ornithine cyclodeaminase/alanine dehydrogenase-like protein (mu-crystallin family)